MTTNTANPIRPVVTDGACTGNSSRHRWVTSPFGVWNRIHPVTQYASVSLVTPENMARMMVAMTNAWHERGWGIHSICRFQKLTHDQATELR